MVGDALEGKSHIHFWRRVSRGQRVWLAVVRRAAAEPVGAFARDHIEHGALHIAVLRRRADREDFHLLEDIGVWPHQCRRLTVKFICQINAIELILVLILHAAE